jgi:hypothetical protein
MVDVCLPDAMIAPFVDQHAPFFMTQDAPLQQITISFSHVLIIPSGYSMASVHPISGGLYPRHWKVEGSIDGRSWVTLRVHENDETMCRYRPTSYWDLDRAPKGDGFFQQFRVTQLGKNAHGTNNLCVSSFEVYGRVLYVENVEVGSASALPRTKILKTGFKSFPPLPIMKATMEVKKKK